MNLKKISRKQRVEDSIRKDMTIVFHSTGSMSELADIILRNQFRAGNAGGAMLGKGFYANQHLYQAKKLNYGRNILSARIFGIKNFLFLEKEPYEEVFGVPASDSFIEDQLADIPSISYIPRGSNSAEIARRLFGSHKNELMKKFGGIVYTGDYDKESVVCWRPEKQVQPLEWSSDGGETWKPVKSFKEELTEDKVVNLGKAELVRSLQRAKDLISRYEGYPDDKLAAAIKSQLARIAEPAKKEVREEIFKQVLKELRPSVNI